MLLLVLGYYFILNKSNIKRDTPNLDLSWSPFDDGENALYVFIIAWAIAFAWVGLFKRPQSLYCSFLRRCDLSEATTVSIFIPDSRGIELLVKDGKEWVIVQYFNVMNEFFDDILANLFSEPSHVEPGQICYCHVKTDSFGVRYFEFQMRRFNYDSERGLFTAVELNIVGTPAELMKLVDGLTTSEVENRLAVIGFNVVNIEDPSFLKTLFREFSRVFYVYQNFMAWTWLNYSYWHMGIVNTLVYTLGGITVSIVNYVNAQRLKQLCKMEGTVNVIRDGEIVTINQSELVPGDIIDLQSGMVYCDMVILKGEIVVDESSLTGESMPIVKTALDITDSKSFDPINHHKHHTVYAGTTIMNQDVQASKVTNKRNNLGLVVKTGSYTMKGEMLREMYFGKPKKFKFDVEVNLVLVILLCYAIFAFSLTIYFLNSQPVYGFFFAIYVVASALPPLLPTVFIVSESISADRLLKKRITVTDPHRILMSGKVRVAFFDKTGTLTEQGLEFSSVTALNTTVDKSGIAKILFAEPTAQPFGDIGRGMGVCHALKRMESNDTGILLGNVIDRKMFEAVPHYKLTSGFGTKSDLVESEVSKESIAIMKQFDFDNKRKTQSVIIRDQNTSKMFIYTKGTAEALKIICQPHSIPHNFEEVVASSAKQGTYQLAMGCRELSSEETTSILNLSRDEIENRLMFVGFINFNNAMKKDTPEVIRQLKEGDIRTVMISGDHIFTAIYIARLSGMIHKESRVLIGNSISEKGTIQFFEESTGEEFSELNNDQLIEKLMNQRKNGCNIELALAGAVWDKLWDYDKVKGTQIAHFVRVIGRCSPYTKVTIVDAFNRDGFITMMCGDGGNDCGALKTAHVGIALSDAEASIVAPFTSLDKEITSVIEVLKEGRCTLASAFSSYKYMIMYGQIETINQMVCAWFAVTFSEWCWVFMDGFWVITMAFSLPYADVAPKLAPNRPTSSILSLHTLASTLGVLLINFLFLVLALGVLFQQDFFQCRKWDTISIADVTAIGDNYESSVVFLVSGYQYITSAIAFNFGFQHRASWWKNWRFQFFVIAWTVIHFTVILYPSTLSCFFRVNCENKNVLRGATVEDRTPIQNPWGHTLMPLHFREIILVIVIMNGVAISIWEYFVINGFVADWIRRQFPKKDRLYGGIGYGSFKELPNIRKGDADSEMITYHKLELNDE
jgi:cation-transporting ATPase 13A3/4/5